MLARMRLITSLLVFLPAEAMQDSSPAPPPPPPRYSERVQPIGDPDTWLTNADFAKAGLILRDGFMLRYQLAIDDTGRVKDCTLLMGGGPERLEKVMCALLKCHGRFRPQKDLAGNPMPSMWHGRKIWAAPAH